jgi:hypothetical protein
MESRVLDLGRQGGHSKKEGETKDPDLFSVIWDGVVPLYLFGSQTLAVPKRNNVREEMATPWRSREKVK